MPPLNWGSGRYGDPFYTIYNFCFFILSTSTWHEYFLVSLGWRGPHSFVPNWIALRHFMIWLPWGSRQPPHGPKMKAGAHVQFITKLLLHRNRRGRALRPQQWWVKWWVEWGLAFRMNYGTIYTTWSYSPIWGYFYILPPAFSEPTVITTGTGVMDDKFEASGFKWQATHLSCMDVDDVGILCLEGSKQYATRALKESQSIGLPKKRRLASYFNSHIESMCL